ETPGPGMRVFGSTMCFSARRLSTVWWRQTWIGRCAVGRSRAIMLRLGSSSGVQGEHRFTAADTINDRLWGGEGMTGRGGMVVEQDLIVPAGDGVALATDVYRPAGPGPFPVLLERTPYDKSAPSRSERTAAVARPQSRAEVAAYFVGHGYAVAYQDCRGR